MLDRRHFKGISQLQWQHHPVGSQQKMQHKNTQIQPQSINSNRFLVATALARQPWRIAERAVNDGWISLAVRPST